MTSISRRRRNPMVNMTKVIKLGVVIIQIGTRSLNNNKKRNMIKISKIKKSQMRTKTIRPMMILWR